MSEAVILVKPDHSASRDVIEIFKSRGSRFGCSRVPSVDEYIKYHGVIYKVKMVVFLIDPLAVDHAEVYII